MDVFKFLGVDEAFVPDMTYRPNVSGVPRSRVLYELLERAKPGKGTREAPTLSRSWGSALARVRRLNLARPRMDGELRRELLESYREDITKLEGLLQRDLSHGLRDAQSV